jgi:replicative DNA helicase
MFDRDFDTQDIATKLRLPPQSMEAEQSVLGGLMLDNTQWDAVAEHVVAADFYAPKHQMLFGAIHALAEASKPVDIITVSQELEIRGELNQVDGLPYLAEIVENSVSLGNLSEYANIVRERSVVRKLLGICGEISERAYDPQGITSEELLEDAERRVFQIAEDRPNQGGPEFVNPLVKTALEKIDYLFNNDSELTGVTTGFTELDKMTAGLNKGDLIIVAARPSMGKTTFAMNIVEAAIMSQEKPVVVFSLEMPADQLVTRMLSSLGRIDQTRVRTGKLEQEDWAKLSAAVNKITDRPLYIDDTSGLSPSEMRSRLRRISRENDGVALVMIDYLQLMKIKGFTEGRTAEISEISRSLKAIAREFNCPVVALSQLNRSLEQRPNKRPINSDLRESGAIEQDADVISFIYRDEVYNDDSPDKGTAEIILGKQRNGPIGTCRLAFVGKHSLFTDLAPDHFAYGMDEE